jgi:hypothetical protein
LIPDYSDDIECKEHGSQYDCNDDNLIKESGSVIIFNDTGDQIYDIVFSRKLLKDASVDNSMLDTISFFGIWGKGDL